MSKLLFTVYAWMQVKCAFCLLSKFDVSRSLAVNNNEKISFVLFRNSVASHTDLLSPPHRGAAF